MPLSFRTRCAAMLVAATALACGERAAPPAPTAAPIVVATTVDLAGVNELVATNTRFTHEILDQLFLQLLEEQPDFADHPPTFASELAESWELADDRRSLTFHLRPDARWSDGAPITANDVLFTWRAQTSDPVEIGRASCRETV